MQFQIDYEPVDWLFGRIISIVVVVVVFYYLLLVVIVVDIGAGTVGLVAPLAQLVQLLS